jgi:hypothetical protein
MNEFLNSISRYIVVYPIIKSNAANPSIDITICLSLQHDTQLIVAKLYFIFIHFSITLVIHFLLSIYYRHSYSDQQLLHHYLN